MLSTTQLSACSKRSSFVWGVTHCGCTCRTLSGKKAEGCEQLSAFRLLSGCSATCAGPSQCLGTLAGWSQGAVKCVYGEWAVIHRLLVLELIWCHSLFLGNSCCVESLPLMAVDMLMACSTGPSTSLSWRNTQGSLCSQSHPCGEVRAQSVRHCTGI